MLTIFSVPKPFQGHAGVIQRNAIGSWRRLRPSCSLILCGAEAGTEAISRQHDAQFLPHINRNELGTPLLDSIFKESCQVATTPLMCYSNADIILLDSFLEAVKRIPFETFLMIGQRITVEQTELIDFTDVGWAEKLTRRALREGQDDGPSAIDYMVFPRESPLREVPAFAVGRPGWDNWFVERARKLGIPVIDATRVVRVLHQKHDYRHVPQARGPCWEGPEAIRNRRLVGWPAQGCSHAYTVRDATHVLTAQGLRRHINWSRHFPLWSWATYPRRLAVRWARKLRIAARMSRRPMRLLAFCKHSIRLKGQRLRQRLRNLLQRRALPSS